MSMVLFVESMLGSIIGDSGFVVSSVLLSALALHSVHMSTGKMGTRPFQIAPRLVDARQKQLYLPDSNILLTRFLATDGVAEISDCMPVEEVEHAHTLVRRVKTVRGEI